MSLQTVAKHLAAQGRGPDTQLVHMTKNEVAGLQSLAQSKGGTLTINPKTGLVEASFLDEVGDVLGGAADAVGDVVQGVGNVVQDVTSSPLGSMLVGAALMSAGLPPSLAGLATGVASLASGNSLGQSVGAGLGAYGGANLAGAAGVGGAAELAPVGDAGTAVLPGGTANATATAPITAPVTETTIPTEAFPVIDTTPTVVAPPPAPPPAPTVQATPTYPTEQTIYPGEMSQAPRVATPQEAFDMGKALPPTTAPTTSGGIVDTLKGYYDKAGNWVAQNPGTAVLLASSVGAAAGAAAKPKEKAAPEAYNYEGAYIRPYVYDPSDKSLKQITPVKAPVKAAAGGIMDVAGPVERMSNANAVGQNTGYPQANIQNYAYATPWQTPVSENMVTGVADTGVNRMTGEMNFASGGISTLGGYSDGGRLLKGPGDGVSDSIPATIADKQPARLADGEFVVPARIVSELGNGSTDAGARELYKMMDRIQSARRKTVGKNKVATNSRATKALPA